MTSYRLRPGAHGTAHVPSLDESQRSVVDHRAGPLLVLAGPGTGKTTTLVEAVVDRVENRGVPAEQVLVLTFSRKAAEELRDRVTARLGRTLATSVSSTFHSFAYGLLRAHAPRDLYAEPLRLLSAPEQDVVLRRLLTHERESVRWPASLDRAVGTRGFAAEVQTVLARARERGLGPDQLVELGVREDRPAWVAAGRFMDQYLDVLDNESAVDYPELVHRAAMLADEPGLRARLRAQYAWVFVDEYQDTDTGQVALLRALAGEGGNLVAVGDPDQSIYAFRGAEVRGILDFPDTFRTRHGGRAPTVALRTCRRFGPALWRASRSVAASIPATGPVDTAAFRAFRCPEAVTGAYGEGRVDVATFDTARAETEHIADLLRRSHLRDEVAWSEMAVLVRSGRNAIPGLRRGLTAAGVPVEVATDDTPLVHEPAVRTLLDGLGVALALGVDERTPSESPGSAAPGVDTAAEVLTGPLGGLDVTELRSLARALRHRERQTLDAGPGLRPSSQLLRDALLDPGELVGLAGAAAGKAATLARLLRRARAELDTGGTAEEVLWTLWQGTAWPARLRRATETGGAGARRAHRDLDAVCALFDVAARTEEQRGHTSVAGFLATVGAQQIPADTLAERGVRGNGVRLLTAHRAKGLEWRVVVVAQVQQEVWPDLRRRSTLLQADRIGADAELPPSSVSALLAEERRLFYVACTRARQRLVVTAVASPEDDGAQPSRFLGELAVAPVAVRGRPSRPLSLPGLVAELRRTVSDPSVGEALRGAAASRLARLAAATEQGHRLAPQADPAHWWGTRGRTVSPRPLRPADEPVTLSASALEGLLTCPARWFLEREAGGRGPSTAAQGFGLVVHVLADRIGKGELPTGRDGVAGLMAHVDRVWGRLELRTPWSGPQQRAEVEAALNRFVAWHERPDARTVIATERALRAEVALPDGATVRLTGYADRLELDENGDVMVIDLKTTKYPPPDRDLPENPQLGLYQAAVDHGAVDDLVSSDSPARSGGAELVQLRKEVAGRAKTQSQHPQQRDEQGRTAIETQLVEAAALVRSERFPARAGKHCEHCDFRAICPIKGAGTVLS